MTITRTTVAVIACALLDAASLPTADTPEPIDRQRVVTRHNVELVQADSRSSLQVGNGDFAVGCDVTGLQTFYGNTLSNWGWHEEPLPVGVSSPERTRTEFTTHGRKRYYLAPHNEPELVRWLYDNPQPHHIRSGSRRQDATR